MTKAVLFDLDGALVDSNDLHVRVWADVFGERGVSVSKAAIQSQIGKGADLLVPALVQGADEKMSEELGEAHGAIFKARLLEQVTPFPKARELLAHTKASGRQVVLASSASQEELEHYLKLLDASAFVDVMTSIDDAKTSKPAPDIFAVALKKAGVAAGEAIMLGDSPFDMEGAAKCGVASVALRSGGFSDEDLRQAGAVALYDDAASLLAGFDSSPLAA